MLRTARRPAVVLLGPLLLTLVGCGDGMARLHGTVSIDGSPAPAGTAFTFVPVAGGTTAYGQTDASGHYTAAVTFQQQGLPPGRYSIKLMSGATQSAPPVTSGGKRTLPQRKPDAGNRYPQAWYREIEQIDVVAGRNRHDINLVLPATEDKPGTLRPVEPQSQKPAVTPAGEPPAA